jgi:ribose transport system substrate-binding protein
MTKRLCLWIAILFFGIGCNRSDDGKIRIAIVPKAMDSEFWQSLKTGAEEEAAKYPDVELVILAPTREINIDQQINILEDQILKGVSALAVAPCGAAEVIPALEKAHEKGIPVITVDTDVDWEHKLSYVGTDNFLGGQLAGRYITNAIDNLGDVALISGIPGVQTHEERRAGFMDAIEGNPNITLVSSQPANSDRELAMTVMENILTSNPGLDAVFVTNDQMALGALEAIAAQGRAGKIVVVGFDAGQEALNAVRDGRLTAVVAQNPSNMGKEAFIAALNAATGKSVPDRIDTGTEIIDRKNVGFVTF